MQPQHALPESMSWIKAIGPFDFASELAVMQEHQVDVLVSKNSGGSATEAKLAAARNLGITVMMLARPELPQGLTIYDELDDCVAAVLKAL